MTEKLEIYDSTLRDGAQAEGINLGLADKLAITAALDDFAIDYIEGGWPGSNPKDEAYFAEMAGRELRHARLVAFGSTHRAQIPAAEDDNLAKLAASGADVIAVFGKSWRLHATDALRVTTERNLELIADSIRYLRESAGRPVFFDAEHFFDGFRDDPGYALASLETARGAGAERLVLCDTNGGSLPEQIRAAVRAARERLPGAALAIHPHNDCALAVANALAGIEEGCVQVQGTVNGIGERCGNVDLCAVIATCELKLGITCLPVGKLSKLTALSRTIWERCNQTPLRHQPFVGMAAFAHKGGVHASAVQRNALTYEHVDPASVGNRRRVLISELAGRSNIRGKLLDRFSQLNDDHMLAAILTEIQEREAVGYSYESADTSFELIVRRHLGLYAPAFNLIHYRVHGLGTDGNQHQVEATIKLRDQAGELRLAVAEGDGPVDALFHALAEALRPSCPFLDDLHLIDFKVRVVNSREGTAAKVRVLVDHRFDGNLISTIGVDENIIEASWRALVEAVDYAALVHGEKRD